ncbi:MAG: hypothetical protein K8S27_10390 [Candidatus Omnitrophica bacterium]|nr:hypothetical protein [Candidatus Omnitrophota bacterium]
MKRIIIAMFILACASCSRTKTTVTEIPLPSGDIVTLKVRSTPGFLDPSIKRTYFVRWANGKKEDLPFLMHIYPDKSLRATVENGIVFLTTARGAAVRKGNKKESSSPWHVWSIEPSDSLYSFLESYAQSYENKSVSFTTYTCSKRLAPGIVHGTEIETNKTIRFDQTDFFLSPTRHTGWRLPHQVKSVDFTSRDVVYESEQNIPSMPKHLVFTGSSDLKQFVFNKEKTKSSNKILEGTGTNAPDPQN